MYPFPSRHNAPSVRHAAERSQSIACVISVEGLDARKVSDIPQLCVCVGAQVKSTRRECYTLEGERCVGLERTLNMPSMSPVMICGVPGTTSTPTRELIPCSDTKIS